VCCRYCPGVLSCVPMSQFGRSNTLKSSTMPSIDARPGNEIRCWNRMSVRFCGGVMSALSGTIVPSGRSRPLKVEPVLRRSPPPHDYECGQRPADGERV
jgi:hypothetical protein